MAAYDGLSSASSSPFQRANNCLVPSLRSTHAAPLKAPFSSSPPPSSPHYRASDGYPQPVIFQQDSCQPVFPFYSIYDHFRQYGCLFPSPPVNVTPAFKDSTSELSLLFDLSIDSPVDSLDLHVVIGSLRIPAHFTSVINDGHHWNCHASALVPTIQAREQVEFACSLHITHTSGYHTNTVRFARMVVNPKNRQRTLISLLNTDYGRPINNSNPPSMPTLSHQEYWPTPSQLRGGPGAPHYSEHLGYADSGYSSQTIAPLVDQPTPMHAAQPYGTRHRRSYGRRLDLSDSADFDHPATHNDHPRHFNHPTPHTYPYSKVDDDRPTRCITPSLLLRRPTPIDAHHSDFESGLSGDDFPSYQLSPPFSSSARSAHVHSDAPWAFVRKLEDQKKLKPASKARPLSDTSGSEESFVWKDINLRLQSGLAAISSRWNNVDEEEGRILVQFSGERSETHLKVTFKKIELRDFDQAMPGVVSCIWWDHPPYPAEPHAVITSVDFLKLLEFLLDIRFNTQENNRCRRNLESCKPITLARESNKKTNKPLAEGVVELFDKIMAFANPKPRNIEKDVKVLRWDSMQQALEKLVDKFCATQEVDKAEIFRARDAKKKSEERERKRPRDDSADSAPSSPFSRAKSSRHHRHNAVTPESSVTPAPPSILRRGQFSRLPGLSRRLKAPQPPGVSRFAATPAMYEPSSLASPIFFAPSTSNADRSADATRCDSQTLPFGPIDNEFHDSFGTFGGSFTSFRDVGHGQSSHDAFRSPPISATQTSPSRSIFHFQ